MAEETTTATQESQVEMQETPTDVNSLLQNSAWGDDTIIAEPQQQAAPTTEAVTTPEETEEEIIEQNEYLKSKWGFESEEAADAEIKSLRELKAKGTSDFKYKNDESRKVAEYINEGKEDELYAFLENKKKVSKLSTADLSNINDAADLVKFGIQKDNPNLNADDVDFLFNKRFTIPDEPVYDEMNESEDEFKLKHKSWEQVKSNIQKELVIEAKIAQPKLAQLKSELVLPEIQRENQNVQKQPTQAELDAYAKQQNDFFEFAKSSVEKFNGVSVQVKDKDVNYTVNYTPSKEEKAFIESKFEQFAKSGYDANAILADLWVKEDGKTLDVERMQKDLFRLYAGDKAEQKLAADSGSKMLEAYLKGKKRININQTPQGTFSPTNSPDAMDRVRDQAFA